MTLDVGMLGYRFMGEAHSNALARLPMFFPDAPDVRRHTLVGRDEAALAEAADRLGFERVETEWAAALEAVDVLYNLGPNSLHEAPSVAALDAGVHVLCEKPLAHTLDAAARMADAARDSDAVAGCAFNYRFVPAIRHARELIASGALGEVRQVRARYLQDWLADPDAPWAWRLDADVAGSGALGDLGSHAVDLASYLLDDDVTRVSGHLRTFVDERPVEGGDGEAGESRPVTVDDAFSAQAAFASGATGVFEASRVATGNKNAHVVEVNGTRGSLRFDLERLNELEVLREDGRGFETVLVTDESDPYVDHWWPPGHVLGWEHTFVHESYEFLSAVAAAEAGETGAESSFSPSFAEGLAVQRVLDAVERSDETGEWVAVG
jgi:predicted dehydrogenase